MMTLGLAIEIFLFLCPFSMKIHTYILFLILAICTGACSSDEEELDPSAIDKNAPIREAFQVRFVFSEMAEVKASVEAPHVIETVINEKSVQIFDRGVEMIFFNAEGEERSRLVSDSAIFTDKFELAEFWRNVVITNIGGERIETKRMHYMKGDSVPTMWAPLVVTPPQPIYKVRHNRLNSKDLPLAISRNFNQKFSNQSDSMVVEQVHHDIDSLLSLEEKTEGDSVLVQALRGTIDTTYTSPEINQVTVQTEKELLYGDSLWAKTDFTRYRMYKISGAVEMEEEL